MVIYKLHGRSHKSTIALCDYRYNICRSRSILSGVPSCDIRIQEAIEFVTDALLLEQNGQLLVLKVGQPLSYVQSSNAIHDGAMGHFQWLLYNLLGHRQQEHLEEEHLFCEEKLRGHSF